MENDFRFTSPKMAPVGNLVDRATVFLLARFPFVNAVTLLLLLGERASRESRPPVEPKLIYVHVILYCICGFFMSMKWKRREATVVYAGQLAFFAYNVYNNPNMNLKDWMRMRIASRQVGIIGICLIFAYLNDRKRQVFLKKMGETLMGIYLFCCAYLLNNTSEDKSAFLWHVPGGDWSRYFISLGIVCSSICFLSGYFLKDISLFMLITTIFTTALVECDINYWTVRKHMDYWNQVRLIIDNAFIIIGFGMIYRKFENNLQKED